MEETRCFLALLVPSAAQSRAIDCCLPILVTADILGQAKNKITMGSCLRGRAFDSEPQGCSAAAAPARAPKKGDPALLSLHKKKLQGPLCRLVHHELKALEAASANAPSPRGGESAQHSGSPRTPSPFPSKQGK